jgi:hypothetical protein
MVLYPDNLENKQQCTALFKPGCTQSRDGHRMIIAAWPNQNLHYCMYNI